MPSNYLILHCPLLLLPSIFASIRVFSNESALCIRWPKYWSFSFNISPSNEHPGLISFMMDWLDLLAVQGTVKSLLQHHSSKASILRHSAFFILQPSHPYICKPTQSSLQSAASYHPGLSFTIILEIPWPDSIMQDSVKRVDHRRLVIIIMMRTLCNQYHDLIPEFLHHPKQKPQTYLLNRPIDWKRP